MGMVQGRRMTHSTFSVFGGSKRGSRAWGKRTRSQRERSARRKARMRALVRVMAMAMLAALGLSALALYGGYTNAQPLDVVLPASGMHSLLVSELVPRPPLHAMAQGGSGFQMTATTDSAGVLAFSVPPGTGDITVTPMDSGGGGVVLGVVNGVVR